MSDEESLLTEAKKAVTTWGGTVRRSYGDEYGSFAFRFTYRGETYIGVSKKSAHNGLASFEQGIARRAAHQEVPLVEFFGDNPTLGNSYVFQPVTVIEDGDVSVGNSKKDVKCEWYQLPLEKGVLLGDFVSGRAVPPEPEPEEKSQPLGITDYC